MNSDENTARAILRLSNLSMGIGIGRTLASGEAHE